MNESQPMKIAYDIRCFGNCESELIIHFCNKKIAILFLTLYQMSQKTFQKTTDWFFFKVWEEQNRFTLEDIETQVNLLQWQIDSDPLDEGVKEEKKRYEEVLTTIKTL